MFQAATPPGITVLTSSSSLFRRLRRNKELDRSPWAFQASVACLKSPRRRSAPRLYSYKENELDTVTIYRVINFAILIVIIVGYPLICILALFSLKKRKLPGLASGIWALIILVIPFLGALAIWIVNPQREIVKSGSREQS